MLAPLGLARFTVAAGAWSALLIASVLGALWLLDVRDWRVLAVVGTASPVISSVRLGTLTPLLILLLAVAWRWRDRRWVAGSALALAISLKLFVWPVVVWLVATRRFGAAACLAAALTLGAWAVVGFDGLTQYPELLRRLTDVVADRGYSLVALGVELGFPRGVADALPWVAGAALCYGVVIAVRRADGERMAFSLALVAALALSPIVWLHYFALLIAPLALAYPRFALPWLGLWAIWLLPGQQYDGEIGWIVLAVLVTTAIAYSVRRTMLDAVR